MSLWGISLWGFLSGISIRDLSLGRSLRGSLFGVFIGGSTESGSSATKAAPNSGAEPREPREPSEPSEPGARAQEVQELILVRLGARAQQVQVLNLGRLEPHRSKVQVLPLVTPGAQVQELSLVISGARA